MVDRGDARIATRVQRPEANAAELSQGPRDNAKLSNAEGAASRRSKRPTLTIGHLETKVVVLDSPLEERTPKPLSSEDAAGQRDQKIHDSSATKQKLHHITEGERTNKLLPRAPVGRADSISVAEVAELVRVLNAQLEQMSSLIVDSLSYRQSPSGRGSEVVSNELRDYLGLWLSHDLQRRSNEPDTEPDPLITQIILQTGLVNACSRIINGWTPPDIGQGVADMRKAQARSYTSTKSNNQDVNEKYLTHVLLELINAVAGSLQSGERLPLEYQEKVQDIANKAVGLHRVINEEVTSSELVTYTIPCGTEFDSSHMEDTEGDGGETGSTPHDRVVCTMEMGLQCRKKVEPKSRQEYGVTLKARVVLASTLEGQGS
ncbi:hypothetical protein M378DRAFT_204577 [Amanita muscaria Koide BX008]|uniref:Uncharacterized protein n=1 Tax=Amanita muscaria (strain Koide BX008) TaxID=946122 RepID=A0A0C2T5J2_AMAMK|nr:hypothetical protein M378DRAFT_204577 [Amanita muscaria Koide BX008]